MTTKAKAVVLKASMWITVEPEDGLELSREGFAATEDRCILSEAAKERAWDAATSCIEQYYPMEDSDGKKVKVFMEFDEWEVEEVQE